MNTSRNGHRFIADSTLYLFFLIPFFFGCSGENKTEKKSFEEVSKSKSVEFTIHGLWSRDSSGMLTNSGYYFDNNSNVFVTASEVKGNWNITKQDSLELKFEMHGEQKLKYKLDVIDQSNIQLSDQSDKHLYRRVPFGINDEGIVLQGFSGELNQTKEKNHYFNISSSKKIKLQLNSTNTSLALGVFDEERELTNSPVREWTAILIRSGKYRVRIFDEAQKGRENVRSYDLKVIAY